MRYLLVLLPTVLASVLYAQGPKELPHTALFEVVNERLVVTDTLIYSNCSPDEAYQRLVHWVEYRCPVPAEVGFSLNFTGSRQTANVVGFFDRATRVNTHIDGSDAAQRTITCRMVLPYLANPATSHQKPDGQHELGVTLTVVSGTQAVFRTEHRLITMDNPDKGTPGAPQTFTLKWPITRERTFYEKTGSPKPEFEVQRQRYIFFLRELETVKADIIDSLQKP